MVPTRRRDGGSLDEEEIPDDVVAELLEWARHRLGNFEDGTPLPDTFEVERDR